MTTTLNYSYYTPVTSSINFEVFEKYLNYIYLQDVSEEVADKMSAIEQQIVNSAAYKSQGIKQPHQNKWQIYKIANKTPLSELCLILNKMNGTNINELIEEAIKYDTLSYVDIKQVADFLLGKCIKESKNIETYCQFFKKAVTAGLWYVYYEEKVVSFLDICLDQLEHNYKDLTKIAGYIEDMYETQRSAVEEIVNGVVISQMQNSELYLKRKNIIVGVIEIIGSFYNNKIISAELIENIFSNLKERYEGEGDGESEGEKINTTIKIYFELWLSLWNCIKNNLSDESYDAKYMWLVEMKELIHCDRLCILIENSLANDDDGNTNIQQIVLDDYIDTTKNLLQELRSDADYKEFANKYSNDMNKYIVKYLLEQCNKDHTKLKQAIEKITAHLISKEAFKLLVGKTLENEDITCDYPNFVKYSKMMI